MQMISDAPTNGAPHLDAKAASAAYWQDKNTRCHSTVVRWARWMGCTLALLCALPLNADCVILLHGLARSSSSMNSMQTALTDKGYYVVNHDYPSRTKPIEALAPEAIDTAIEECGSEQPIHFVTHSLGGILVRAYLAKQDIEALGRVVMLAPPNQGSEVVDDYRDIPGYRALNGPAGLQLGTDASSLPRQLGSVSFDLGVIAGTATFNPILSLSLPNPDDGKVSVASTKVEGMRDFMTVRRTHTFIMRAPEVIEQVAFYLENGRFEAETEANPAKP